MTHALLLVEKKVHARGNQAQWLQLSISPIQSASLYMQHGRDALERGSRSTETETMKERDVHTCGYANVHYIHSSILLSHFWAVHRVRLVFRHSLHTHDASTRSVLEAELMPSPEGGRCNGHFFLGVCTKIVSKTTPRKLEKKKTPPQDFSCQQSIKNRRVTMTSAPRHPEFFYLKQLRERENKAANCAHLEGFLWNSYECLLVTSHDLNHFWGAIAHNATVMTNYGVWVIRAHTRYKQIRVCSDPVKSCTYKHHSQYNSQC